MLIGIRDQNVTSKVVTGSMAISALGRLAWLAYPRGGHRWFFLGRRLRVSIPLVYIPCLSADLLCPFVTKTGCERTATAVLTSRRDSRAEQVPTDRR